MCNESHVTHLRVGENIKSMSKHFAASFPAIRLIVRVFVLSTCDLIRQTYAGRIVFPTRNFIELKSSGGEEQHNDIAMI